MFTNKKVLFITDNDNVSWGGSEELWAQTALSLSSKMQISVFVKKWDHTPEKIKMLQNEGITVLYKPNRLLKKDGLATRISKKIARKSTNNSSNDLAVIPQINEYDLVVISMCDAISKKTLKYVSYLRKNNVKYALLIQLATDLRMVPDMLSEQLSEAYKKAEKVFFLSKDNAEKTQMLLGVRLENIEYTNNPFNYNQEYTSYQATKDHFNLACVASFKCFHKGQDLLISALSKPQWKDRNIRVHLYGDGVNKAQILRLIKANNLEKKVKIMGFENDKNLIWKNNVGCIMPSRMEGQSLAMLEAMSHGRMIISTRVGDAERLIEDEKTGFLINHPTVESIQETLEKAWNLRGQWQKMGIASRKRLFSEIQESPVISFSKQILESI